MLGSYLLIKLLVIIVILVVRFAVKAGRKNSSSSYVPPPNTNYNYNNQQQNYNQPYGNYPPANGYPQNTPQQNGYAQHPQGYQQMPDYTSYTPPVSAVYCKYCGKQFQNANALRADTCFRHPDTSTLQKHEVFEGPGAPNVTM